MKKIYKTAIYSAFGLLLSSSAAFAESYYVMVDGKQTGPTSIEKLKQMKQNGQLSKNTMVWKDGMAGWESAVNQVPLQFLFASMPPPPPAMSSSVPVPPPVAASQAVSAAQNDQAIDQDVVNNMLENPDFISSSEQIRSAMDEFARNKKITFGKEDARGRIYYKATQTVDIEETNPQFTKWRVSAYNGAYLKIRQEFLEQIYGKMQGETLAKMFLDDSDNQYKFKDFSDSRATSKEGEIYNKLLGLTGAKLDRALAELDIDPSEYDKAPPEQRKNLFKNSLVETSLKRASGSLTGLMPIKTFVGIDTKGNHTVGVVAMYYGKLKQLADDIVKKRTPMLVNKKSGKPLNSMVPQDKKVLADTFGIRLAFNELGEPTIISYGQWGNSYNGSKQRKIDRAYDFAYKKAKTESQKQIAAFLKANATFKEIANTSTSIVEDAVKDREGNISTQEISEMIDTLEQTTKIKFNADLRGIKEYSSWSHKFKTGQQVVGVVSIWTQKNAEGVDKIRNWKSNYKNPNQQQPKYQPSHQSGVGAGAGMDADF